MKYLLYTGQNVWAKGVSKHLYSIVPHLEYCHNGGKDDTKTYVGLDCNSISKP